MNKELQRVLIAVPIAKRVLAGKEYTKHTKNAADDDSFTAGYFDAGNAEWGVACWAIDKTTVAQFDALIAAYPAAKVRKWLDAESSPEQQLTELGLSRPVAPMGGGGGGKLESGGGGAYAASVVTIVQGVTYTIVVAELEPTRVQQDDELIFIQAAVGEAGGTVTGGLGGQAGDSTGDAVYSGGNGVDATGSTGGNGGGGATSSANGANGGGGAGSDDPGQIGVAGMDYGNGGGGGYGDPGYTAGGAEGPGRVLITYS